MERYFWRWPEKKKQYQFALYLSNVLSQRLTLTLKIYSSGPQPFLCHRLVKCLTVFPWTGASPQLGGWGPLFIRKLFQMLRYKFASVPLTLLFVIWTLQCRKQFCLSSLQLQLGWVCDYVTVLNHWLQIRIRPLFIANRFTDKIICMHCSYWLIDSDDSRAGTYSWCLSDINVRPHLQVHNRLSWCPPPITFDLRTN